MSLLKIAIALACVITMTVASSADWEVSAAADVFA
jgi:hypothetical protein